MTLGLFRVLNTILNVVMAVITFFLGLRIVLRLFAANPSTPFVQWIYNISDGLMAPFSGIFPSTSLGQNATFDLSAFIALVAYTILFYLIGALIRAVSLPRDNYIVTDNSRVV
jgi:uncharacterized protein YggT (Ycf19 family)